MINSLSLVSYAVAVKPLIPVMQFLYVYDGEDGKKHIQAYNGKICIDTVTDFPFNVTVKADKFIRAIKLCGKSTRFSITKTERLSVISGKFRALIETTQDKFPVITNAVTKTKLLTTTNLIHICKTLKPFISEDASRSWSCSILFRDGYAYATNNIIIARVPCPEIPNLILPSYAVDALCSLGKEPQSIHVSPNYSIFQLTEDTWLRASHLTDDWPPVEEFVNPVEVFPLPENFEKELTSIIPFCKDPKFPVIYMDEEGIHTMKEDFGASLGIGSFHESKFRVEMLLQVAENATHANFTNYPKPCYFKGSNDLDGIIMGVR